MQLKRQPAVPTARRHFVRQLGLLGLAAGLPQLLWAADVARKARRIVSIGGGVTEILYALGAEKELVGVDTTSLYPEAATKLPNVGYARALSSEGILALSPTQLIVTEDAGPPAVMRQIATAGVPVHVLPANDRFEGVIDRVQRVGSLLDRVPQATQLVEKLKADWQHAREPILARKTEAPRMLFIMSMSPAQVMVAGKNTGADAMIQYAGARNVVQEYSGYKPLTPEAVIAAQPDIILVTDQGLAAVGGVDGILKLPGLAQTPAGQKRRVVSLETMFMLGFGPRLPQALSALDAAILKAMHA